MSAKSITHEKWKESIATTMKTARGLKGIGMREHAKQLGISPATLSRIERGFGCDVSMMLFIHEVTGISLYMLMGLPAPRRLTAKETQK